MKIWNSFLLFLTVVYGSGNVCEEKESTPSCISFTVTQGTGCAWMCNYCANQLGTNNYYFTDNVCTYKEGVGCVGSPYAGVSYTCCSSS
jgi:hypothetical protein